MLNATGGRFPSLDFAGGTVVHITSGVSALVCCLYLGKRIGYPHTNMPPHSMVLSFIGACLLWVGWFGFNAGSALAASSLATSAFVNTHFAAAAAAIGWSIAEWIHNGKPTALGAISGAVAGLVAITPASGFVQPIAALVIGLIAGVFCFFMVFMVKSFFGYDDSLDAFGVHGAGGTLGALLTGLFATSAINAAFKDAAGNRSPPAPSTATGASCSTSPPASALPGASPSSARWSCSSSWTSSSACASRRGRSRRPRPLAAQRGRLRPEL